MNKNELIKKLHMIYAGDRNSLEEMIGYYDGLKELIKITQENNEKLIKRYGELKSKVYELREELIKDRMEQFDDYTIYLQNKYLNMLGDKSNE